MGERAKRNPGRAMAVAVAWYGGLREMIYIYRLFVKFVVPTAGSDKRNPRWQAGVGLGKGYFYGNDTSFFCRVSCDSGRALLKDICHLALY